MWFFFSTGILSFSKGNTVVVGSRLVWNASWLSQPLADLRMQTLAASSLLGFFHRVFIAFISNNISLSRQCNQAFVLLIVPLAELTTGVFSLALVKHKSIIKWTQGPSGLKAFTTNPSHLQTYVKDNGINHHPWYYRHHDNYHLLSPYYRGRCSTEPFTWISYSCNFTLHNNSMEKLLQFSSYR